MKLMGKPKLFAAAHGPSVSSRGACAALCAELEAADWTSGAAVAADYPNADWDGEKLIVRLDDQLSAIVAFNYIMGIALIEFAGRRVDRTDPPTRRRTRS
jgi:hypothetical protein